MAETTTAPNTNSLSNRQFNARLFLVAGVVLPLMAAIFESTTHFCAQHFFDPFPSISHVLLFLLIPLSNFLVWLAERRDLSEHYASITLATGMAAGVALMYSLMFLPILGLSLLFTLAAIGLFGLAPLIGLLCSLRSGNIISELAVKRTYFDPHQVKHIGHLIVLVLVVALELPSTLTRIHLEMAENPTTTQDGVQWLRLYGNQEVMLRACYERSGRATDILGSLYECAHPLSVDSARSIFYKVSGQPFNSVPLPAAARATIKHAGLVRDVAGLNAQVEDEFDLDADIAGETVSGEARGLSGVRNCICVALNSYALQAQIDWSLTLKNTSKYDREARAKLMLPKGAVVTKAFMVVDGVEREAIILARAAARIKYVQAVSRRQDPLLVSMCGPDEVLVQCFPVVPNQPVTIKLTIACPMNAATDDDATLEPPVLAEKNFRLNVPVKLWVISGPGDISVANSIPVKGSLAQLDVIEGAASDAANFLGDGSMKASRNEVSLEKLNELSCSIHAKRMPRSSSISCRDVFVNDGAVVRRSLGVDSYPLPQKLIVIVDGSDVMRGVLADVTAGLKALPANISAQLVAITDSTTETLVAKTNVDHGNFAESLAALDHLHAIGGQDDSKSLLAGVQEAYKTPGTAVLWVHGWQPVNHANLKELKQTLNGTMEYPLLYDFRVAAGPVACLEGMSNNPAIVRVPRAGSVQSDLSNLFKSWRANWKQPVLWTRSSEQLPEGQPIADKSLAQVYAYDQILMEARNGAITPRAIELATTYHVVSPVSSAIVRPTESNDEERVATGIGPESDTWLLLLIALGFVAAHVIAQRKKQTVTAA